MPRVDASETSDATYECHDCLRRVQAPDSPGPCPECGGTMRNITVPRE